MIRNSLRFGALMWLSTLGLSATPPTISSVSAPSVNSGQAVTLQASVADVDGDLKSVVFSVSGPGISGWQTAATVTVTGASASPSTSWSAPSTGLYTVQAVVSDQTNATATASSSFDVFAGITTLNPVVVPYGSAWMVEFPGQIMTTENDTATTIDVQSGSNVILWSGGRVTLLPGFHAENGSFFWATVDHNMNGYSDMEEATDSDGDGIPDAWEVDHGLNPADPTDAGKLAADGSGYTNLQEYQMGRDPRNKADDTTLPQNVQIVLRDPSNQFHGLSTITWSLSSVSSP